MADLPAPENPHVPTKPKVPAVVLGLGAFVLASGLALAAGWGLAQLVESRSAEVVKTRLLTAGHEWAHVETDGLIVTLSGTAPSEAQRFSAVNVAGGVVDPSRLVDSFQVLPATVVAPPRFSVEMLRNDDGVQLIGLVPDGQDRETLTEAADALKAPDAPMDMLETAAYPAPPGWTDALRFGMTALKLLPRAKISVAAEGVTIVAIAGSDVEKRRFEAALRAAAPKGLKVSTSISAPRPVLTPFTLRFVIDARGARFDACSADTEAARAAILTAAAEAGAKGGMSCTIGMGVPSPHWAEATSAAIKALKALGEGTVTFSDADITLLAGDSVTRASFDRAVGELRAALPDVFSLDAKMPEKAQVTAGPVEFTAALDPKSHQAELRGRLGDDRMQAAVASFAKAHFGVSKVYVATLLDPTLPDGWTERVLAGLQALAALDSGKLLVRADTVEISGVSGSKTASDTISQILSDRLGQGKTFKVDVTYDKALDPMAGLPTPQECLERVDAVQTSGKITFDPGLAELDAGSSAVMDKLALALKNCGALRLEIGGHTDAQGSTQGNLALSQARAEAVMTALQARMVDISGMRAVGYGEGVPIADNGTDEGREANRRIEFHLIDQPIGDVPGQGTADQGLAGLAGLVGKAQGSAPPAPDAQTSSAASSGAAPATPADTAATPPNTPPADPATPPPAQADGQAGTPPNSPPDAAAPVAETAADGSPLAPEKPTLRPRARPQK